ncbi:MAG: hypothetical protein L0G94_07860 [Brachybacterium sp.]|uniref:hypothetical protein n=1 Tax=Brachybacterium sp. TaxID=1891286 RepID=UPI002647188A|nr:hypothetical protein [Brachybacterium sp.]MDN5686582.1 hypothetical protein [Brachybacterium sp.]
MTSTTTLGAHSVRVLLACMIGLAASGVSFAAVGRQDVAVVLGMFELDLVWIGVLVISMLLHRRGVPVLVGWRDIARAITPERVRRVVLTEIDLLFSLARVALHRPPRVPAGSEPIPAQEGTLAIPLAFTLLTLVEVVALHLVLPWPEFSAALTVISVYGVLLMLGVIASRWDHPHHAASASLVLNNGAHVVADILYEQISYVVPVLDGSVTSPGVEHGVARLATMNGCSVAVGLESPHPVVLSGSRRARVHWVSEIRFAADDASDIVTMLEARRG